LKDNRPSFANIGTQANMLTDADNATVDHLFKYENMSKYVVFLEGKLKTTLAPKRLNISPQRETVLDHGLRRDLEAALSDDFDLWENAR
ncbi:MAG: gamma-glutamyl kinase, partial [Halocynthiibacter sp.]